MAERIAVIQPDRVTRELVADVLRATGFEVAAFDNAWLAAAHGDFRLVVTDTVGTIYDRATSERMVRRLRATFACPVLVLTAHRAANGEGALRGSDAVVLKPFDLGGFVRAVRRLAGSAERRRLPRAS
jgi:DNA-binding response OmpR family regulator